MILFTNKQSQEDIEIELTPGKEQPSWMYGTKFFIQKYDRHKCRDTFIGKVMDNGKAKSIIVKKKEYIVLP